jgi:hypothetical protein
MIRPIRPRRGLRIIVDADTPPRSYAGAVEPNMER